MRVILYLAMAITQPLYISLINIQPVLSLCCSDFVPIHKVHALCGTVLLVLSRMGRWEAHWTSGPQGYNITLYIAIEGIEGILISMPSIASWYCLIIHGLTNVLSKNSIPTMCLWQQSAATSIECTVNLTALYRLSWGWTINYYWGEPEWAPHLLGVCFFYIRTSFRIMLHILF